MLPNLIVIGAMKAGTTSLHYYLSLHPEIFMSEDKEPTFFTTEKNWTRGLSWYASLFPTTKPIRGESSPDYTKFPAIDGVPARIHSILPEVALIYLVREPIDRVISHYVDAFSFGRVHRPINHELADFDGHHFVNCSRYAMQLDQYLAHFDRRQLLVVTSDDLRDMREEVMREIFSFLDVDPNFASEHFRRVLYTGEEKRRKTRLGYAFDRLNEHARRSQIRSLVSPRLVAPLHALNARWSRPIPRPELDPSLRRELADYLSPDVERLRAMINKPLLGWPRSRG